MEETVAQIRGLRDLIRRRSKYISQIAFRDIDYLVYVRRFRDGRAIDKYLFNGPCSTDRGSYRRAKKTISSRRRFRKRRIKKFDESCTYLLFLLDRWNRQSIFDVDYFFLISSSLYRTFFFFSFIARLVLDLYLSRFLFILQYSTIISSE